MQSRWASWPVVWGLAVSTVVGLSQSTIDPAHSQAWSPNAGWIDWRADGTHGARVGEYVCSGFLYAANLGWISLGTGQPVNGVRYQNQSAADFGINRASTGELSGLAYGANIGWIVFTNRAANGALIPVPTIDLRSGRFSGVAYGANVGWISLSNAVAFVQTGALAPGADSDQDGLPDAWELEWTGRLDRLSSGADLDGDRATDGAEYQADTNPGDGADVLRIVELQRNPGGASLRVTWSAEPTRAYLVQHCDALGADALWIDSVPGRLYPTNSTLSATIPAGATARYVRVAAVSPMP